MWTFHGATDVTTVSQQFVAGGVVYVIDTSNRTTAPQYPYEEVCQTVKHMEVPVSYRAMELYKEYCAQRRASRLRNLLRFKQQEAFRAPQTLLVSPLIRWMAKALIGGQK